MTTIDAGLAHLRTAATRLSDGWDRTSGFIKSLMPTGGSSFDGRKSTCRPSRSAAILRIWAFSASCG